MVDIVQLEDPWRVVDQYQGGGVGIAGRPSFKAHHGETWWERGIRTLELFTRIASQSEGEGADKLFKADFAVLVSVKDAEEVFCKLARVTIGEEPLVEVPKLLPIESSVWIVSQELVVPVCVCVLADRDRERDV